ncbi:Autophagy-related protein 27 [Grifola frondosa]|uniref:Autophagy-related protein 27 n=1 Tax=Grifola frondosa TaxID=5627 RepID=A0A1C7M104_GRIFR|nr:Autophagy-related protein 27 [Grifola frondosa]
MPTSVTLRRHPLSSLFLLLSLASAFASAQDPFDCYITDGNLKYDLNSLEGERTVTRESEMPPSIMVETVTFNLCKDLEQKEGVSSEDQCPSGTRACLTRASRKGDGDAQTLNVVPLAKSSRDDLEFTSLSSPTKGLSLTFKGPSYPILPGSDPIPQSFNLKLLCSTETSDPLFSSYDNKDVWVEWSAPAGCGFGASEDPDDKPGGDVDNGDGHEEKTVGSGIGYFFLLLLLAFVAYFALGAYYNYSTYGATGVDLIPHRDFWREVPYMLRDVVSHLCSAVRPRRSSSRGGYIAVSDMLIVIVSSFLSAHNSTISAVEVVRLFPTRLRVPSRISAGLCGAGPALLRCRHRSKFDSSPSTIPKEEPNGMPRYAAYVVTIGTEPGVYDDWGEAGECVLGVPGSLYKGYSTRYDAEEAFRRAQARGTVKVVHMHGERRRRAASSPPPARPAGASEL